MQAFLVDSGDHTAVSAVRSVDFVGNRTECALLLMLRGWGHDYKGIRDSHRGAIQKVYTFSSATKMASVLVQVEEGSYRLYVKVSLPLDPYRTLFDLCMNRPRLLHDPPLTRI